MKLQRQQKQIDANFLSLMTFAGKLGEQQQQQQPSSIIDGQQQQALVAPCTVSRPVFVVPTEEEAYARARVVFMYIYAVS